MLGSGEGVRAGYAPHSREPQGCIEIHRYKLDSIGHEAWSGTFLDRSPGAWGAWALLGNWERLLREFLQFGPVFCVLGRWGEVGA